MEGMFVDFRTLNKRKAKRMAKKLLKYVAKYSNCTTHAWIGPKCILCGLEIKAKSITDNKEDEIDFIKDVQRILNGG